MNHPGSGWIKQSIALAYRLLSAFAYLNINLKRLKSLIIDFDT